MILFFHVLKRKFSHIKLMVRDYEGRKDKVHEGP